ncbi:hypothetical protein ACGFK1_05470 [Mycobacterium sp. NPDC048908]|uniref:hypothetical protein n=1 Tax=Mycobacterium sp. NPDC048908 TaxID=3364292 RepID=UPI00371D2EDB
MNRRPLRSIRRINCSASSLRPSEIIASTESGMNDAAMISVPGIALSMRRIGARTASASA